MAVSKMHFPEDARPATREPETAMILMPETRNQALAVPDQARALVVRDQETLDVAKGLLCAIDELKARVDESFDPHIAQAHKLHKSLLAEKKKFADPLDSAKMVVSRKAADYIAEQERIRNEAERKRLAVEAQAREIADKAVSKAEKLGASGKEEAAAATVNGAYEKVQSIMEAAPEIPEELDTKGLTVREDWKFSIVDAALVPREYLIPDEKKIGRIVRAMKDQTNIPGVRVYAESGVATRTPRSFERP